MERHVFRGAGEGLEPSGARCGRLLGPTILRGFHSTSLFGAGEGAEPSGAWRGILLSSVWRAAALRLARAANRFGGHVSTVLEYGTHVPSVHNPRTGYSGS